jgi:hypothetical protein
MKIGQIIFQDGKQYKVVRCLHDFGLHRSWELEEITVGGK